MSLTPYRILGASHSLIEDSLLITFECAEGFFYAKMNKHDLRWYNPMQLDEYECIYTWVVIYERLSTQYKFIDYYIQINSNIRLYLFKTTPGELVEMLI